MEKTPLYITETVFGASGPKRNAKYLTAALQYALDAGYCPEESVEKLSNEKPLMSNLKKQSFQ